jgi:ABC-type dipeptide/oligopeptide/nickel transport system permease subunit
MAEAAQSTTQGEHRIAPSRPRRFVPVRAGGWIGGIVLGLMALLCFGSLPWTMGRVAPAVVESVDEAPADELGADPRRYERADLDAALLPPFWAGRLDDEEARLAALAERDGDPYMTVLGTDRAGRDLLARLLLGGAISLGIGMSGALVAVVIGTSYGMVSGFAGGRTDAVMMRIVDILYGLPNILLVVLLAVAVDGLIMRAGTDLAPGARQMINLATLLVAIGGVTWLTMARVIRGQVLSLRGQPFMEACRATGVPARRQLMRHLLPNLAGPIIVYATLTVPAAILSESFLSFLGIGVNEPLPSWGNLAATGLSELNTVRSRWWLLLWPCVAIALTLLSLNFVGEQLRERLDPKRRARRITPTPV